MLVTTLRCWWHSWRCWVVSGFYIIAIKASGVKILKIKILSATSYNCHQHTVFAKITAALSQSFWHLKIAWHRHNDGVITTENSDKRKLEGQVHKLYIRSLWIITLKDHISSINDLWLHFGSNNEFRWIMEWFLSAKPNAWKCLWRHLWSILAGNYSSSLRKVASLYMHSILISINSNAWLLFYLSPQIQIFFKIFWTASFSLDEHLACSFTITCRFWRCHKYQSSAVNA